MQKMDGNENLMTWVGNKTRLLSFLLPNLPSPELLPRRSRYFEPFAGGLAVFWAYGSHFKHATISDTNADLIGFYECVRDVPDKLIRAARTIKSRETASNHEKLFYNCRSRLNSLRAKSSTRRLSEKERIEKAALFLYIVKHGFNAIYRINSAGLVNTPYRRKRVKNFPTPDHIHKMSEMLQHADLKVCGFEQALRSCKKGDFVFLDPPYFQCQNSFYIRYTQEDFVVEHQAALRDECDRLSRLPAYFAQTNSNCKGISEMYDGYSLTPIVRSHGIERRKGTRAAKEILIKNYDLAC